MLSADHRLVVADELLPTGDPFLFSLIPSFPHFSITPVIIIIITISLFFFIWF